MRVRPSCVRLCGVCGGRVDTRACVCELFAWVRARQDADGGACTPGCMHAGMHAYDAGMRVCRDAHAGMHVVKGNLAE